jgi:hypothetical protein
MVGIVFVQVSFFYQPSLHRGCICCCACSDKWLLAEQSIWDDTVPLRSSVVFIAVLLYIAVYTGG